MQVLAGGEARAVGTCEIQAELSQLSLDRKPFRNRVGD